MAEAAATQESSNKKPHEAPGKTEPAKPEVVDTQQTSKEASSRLLSSVLPDDKTKKSESSSGTDSHTGDPRSKFSRETTGEIPVAKKDKGEPGSGKDKPAD